MSENGVLKIIVAGANGRMGRTITTLVRDEPGFALGGAVDTAEHLKALADLPCVVSDDLGNVIAASPGCVVIDFTSPAASLAHASVAANNGCPIVIGTTGFDETQKEQLARLAAMTPLLWSANMSIGVNVLMAILPELAKALGKNYDFEMMELHHRRKKDAPSGTALMLGEAVAKARGWSLKDTRRSSRDGIIGERPDREIGIQALRGGDVVGIHSCYFLGPGEIIEVTHQAESRENFAQGALRAALWLSTHKAGKLYSMADVIAVA